MYVCLSTNKFYLQPSLFTTQIPDQGSAVSACRLPTSDMKQPTTDWTRLRCHYKMLCTRYYSCTVSPLSTVMWNSVDIGQRIIYSWICQNCTSQHLAITSASAAQTPVQTRRCCFSCVFANLCHLKDAKILLTFTISILYLPTYNQHYYWLQLSAVDGDILYCNVKV